MTDHNKEQEMQANHKLVTFAEFQHKNIPEMILLLMIFWDSK